MIFESTDITIVTMFSFKHVFGSICTYKGLSTLAPGIGNRSQNQSQKLLFKNAFAGKKHFKCVNWLLVERVNISGNP